MEKGNRYGELDAPLVVAINSGAFTLDKIDVMQALFGQESHVDVDGEFETRRKPNGVWHGPDGVRYTRISEGRVFNDLKPSNIANRKHAVNMNPFAKKPVPDFLLDLPSRRPEGDNLVEKDGLCIRGIFDMPEDWPESADDHL